jgi:15-cis-phytoene synthase
VGRVIPGAGTRPVDKVAAPGPPRGGRVRGSAGSSFHYSFGLLPPERKRGIECVYAFCRAIDDLADEGPIDPETAAAGLRLYREEIARCYGGEPGLAVTRDLQACVRRFGIPREPLEDLLAGVEMDLRVTRYETFDDLRVYCRRVASAVGLVCLPIFGCGDPRSRDYAVDLGIALQLTNILRDLKADAARGRIDLPLDEIDRFGYSEAELLAGVRNAAFVDLMRHQVERADRHFALAARALPERERPRLLAAEVMGAIYRRLLRRIEADGFRVFDRRITVPRTTQIALALRAWATGRVDAR